jgi:ACS family glucarate transporter-like MFS transporter
MDIGGSRSGSVSAAMNMVGNMGAAVSAVAFPYFVANVTIPVVAETPGTANSFFVFAAIMNALAVIAWLFMNPQRKLKEASPAAMKSRLAFFIFLIVFVLSTLIYVNFLRTKEEARRPPNAVDQHGFLCFESIAPTLDTGRTVRTRQHDPRPVPSVSQWSHS